MRSAVIWKKERKKFQMCKKNHMQEALLCYVFKTLKFATKFEYR